MAESNHDLPRLENPQTSNHFSKRAVMHTSMTAHQNAAMDFAPRTPAGKRADLVAMPTFSMSDTEQGARRAESVQARAATIEARGATA
ncbi:hypothetical protein ACC699_36565, partial [Rhizobium ruizarguesonis]